jgi:hypothetical protein
VSDGHSDLLRAIQKGRELKHVEANTAAVGGGQDDLLSEIRKGKQLKAVADQEPHGGNAPAEPELTGMAAALAKALNQRKQVMQSDSDEDTSDSDGDSEVWTD